jgi:cyclophilin family peptidyl-prolyl cis-trans isomerase
MSYIELYGLIRSPAFHQGKDILKGLSREVRSVSEGMLEADWEIFQYEKINKVDLNLHVLCYVDGTLIGGIPELSQLAIEKYKYIESGSQAIYSAEAESSYIQKISSVSKKYILWYIKINEGPEKKLVLELDHQNCPKTTENFWQLSNGYKDLTYEGSTIHRLVPEGYIEGGFINTPSGKTHNSIYGDFFPDENYSYLHNKPGVLGMSKFGRNQNGSLFYITLRPLPHLNGNMVAFGRVVEGMDVIRSISSLQHNNQRPVNNIVITKSKNYLAILMPNINETRPKSHKDHGSSKLENADLETLISRREAIVKEIESTRQELEQQKILRNMISDMIAEMTS